MTRTRLSLVGVVLVAILVVGMPAFAQNHPDGNQGSAAPPKSDSTKPGAVQACLAKLAGEYSRVIEFVKPAGKGMATFSGTAKISVVPGGRFLLEESTDTVMGRTVDGLRMYGYNNVTKQYEMTRMYTMSTGITIMAGVSTDGGKTIEFTSGTDAGKMPLRAHFKIVDADQFTVTMSTTGDDGKDAPFQKADYTRKK